MSRKSATVTEMKSYVITNFDNLVYVYKTYPIPTTNFNTVYTTDARTVMKTQYNTVVVTSIKLTTVTKDLNTTQQAVVFTKVVLTGASTTTNGTTTIYGKI